MKAIFGFRKRALLAGIFLPLLILIAFLVWRYAPDIEKRDYREVRILGWVGYEENDFISAFTEETGIQVKVRTAAGGDAVMAIFAAQPTEFDIVILDPEYIQKLAPAGRILPLDYSSFSWEGYPEVVQSHPAIRVGGQLFGIPLRFGSNGLVFNTEKIPRGHVTSYEVLWSDLVLGRIGVWDWYLPSMGVLSLFAGNRDTPYRLTDSELDRVVEHLRLLRPRIRAIHASPRDMLAALAAGDTWIVPAGGEWVAGLLRAEGHPIDWTVPREGGIMWMETALIPAQAKRTNLAMEFIRWAQSPRAQALLATRRAYYGVPCNSNAIPLLSRDTQDVLHVHSEIELIDLFTSLRIRELPQNQTPEEWQNIWERFKANALP